MARSYKGVSVKSHRVYTVEDIKSLYKVNSNTVSNWVGEGLITSDRKRPHVFRGAMIKYFHGRRIARSKNNLRPGEFKCMACKAAVFPEIETVADRPSETGRMMHSAVRPDCGVAIWKLSNATDCDIIYDCRNPNTTWQRLYEDIVRGLEISGELMVVDRGAGRGKSAIYQVMTPESRQTCPAEPRDCGPDKSGGIPVSVDIEVGLPLDGAQAATSGTQSRIASPPPQRVEAQRDTSGAVTQNDVDALLHAAGVQAPDDQPFFWCRKEHRDDLTAMLERTGHSNGDLCAAVAQARADGRQMERPPRRLTEILDIVKNGGRRG